jgi:hypothetical protein
VLNLTAKERDHLSRPPGALRRYQPSSAKHHYSAAAAAAFADMPVPFMVTLAAKKRLTTTEWLDLVVVTLTPLNLDLTVDCFRQERDRSVHVCIYGLPQGKEASVTTTLQALCKSLGGRAGKRKSKAGRPGPRFLVPGLSLAYAFCHDDFATGKTSLAQPPT